MDAAALRLSYLATRNEARTGKGLDGDDAAGAGSGALWGRMAVARFFLQRQTASQCLLSLPPWEGRGMGVVTLSLSCLATCEEGAPARAKG